MPQDIPLEAGEAFTFTPPALANLDNPPRFTLRTPTPREKRHLMRQHREEGVRTHDVAAMREETLRGLEALWDRETFEQHSPVLKAFWEAQDDFAKQIPDLRAEAVKAGQNPDDIKFEYDPELERACFDLQKQVAEAHKPLRKMHADNADFSEMHPVIFVSVMLQKWTGIDVRREVERGYLTVSCVQELSEALEKFEDEIGLEKGTSFGEIYAAAVTRMYLGQEEAKNFVSPSPSETSPAVSTEKAPAKRGKSPASTACSTETLESA